MVLELVQWNITPVSIFFILFFLPLSLFAYYVLPVKTRKSSLIIISGAFLLMVVPNQLPLIIGVTAITVILCRKIATLEKSRLKTIYFALAVLINAGTWIIFASGGRYTNFPYLLGVGVFPFLGVYLASACYNAEKGNQPIFSSALLYLIFFPRLYVGPLMPIDDFWEEGIDPNPAGINLKDGLEKFARGGFQFVFLGLRLLNLATKIAEMRPQEVTMFSSWIMMIALGMGIYHTISGFMLVSCGISEMYGMKVPDSVYTTANKTEGVHGFVENFNRPLFKFYSETLIKGVSEKFSNKYIKIIVALVMGALMGLWYGFNITFLVLGLFLAIAVLLERGILKKYLQPDGILSKLYVAVVLVLSCVILALGQSGWSINVLKALFIPFKTSFNNDITMYLFSSNFVTLLLGFLLITKVPDILAGWVNKLSDKLSQTISLIFHLGLFGILITLLV